MTIYREQRAVSPGRTRSGRFPYYSELAGASISAGAAAGGAGGSGGVDAGSENIFSENQYFAKSIFVNTGLYLGDYVTPNYAALTYNYANDRLISSAKNLMIYDFEVERSASGELTLHGDVKATGDLHINGTIYSYSSDEINVGDSWFNLGVADVTGQDGGLRILTASGSSVMSQLWYDVSSSAWFTDTKQIASRAATLTNNYVPIYDSANGYFKNSTLLYDGSKFKVGSNFLALYNSLSTNTLLQWDGSKVTSSNTLNNSLTINANLTVGAILQSDDFSGSGYTSTGWSVSATGAAVFESIIVRGTLSVFELVKEQIRVSGVSMLLKEGAKVVSVDGSKIRYDSEETIFAVDQILRCQAFTGATKLYQIKVATVGTETYAGKTVAFITYTLKYGSDSPAEGDFIARVDGNLLELSSNDGGYMQIAEGPDVYTSTAFTSKMKFGNIDGNDAPAIGASATATGYGLNTPFFTIDDTGVYAINAVFDNCTISGRFTLEYSTQTLSSSTTTTTIYPTSNSLRFHSSTTGVSRNVNLTKGAGTWKDGFSFTVVCDNDFNARIYSTTDFKILDNNTGKLVNSSADSPVLYAMLSANGDFGLHPFRLKFTYFLNDDLEDILILEY